MEQLEKLKIRLGNPIGEDELLEMLLEDASEIICEIRNSNIVENKYLGVQIRIAVELYNKIGAEGQIAHDENGIKRMYEKSDVSNSLLSRITPVVRTLNSGVRIIQPEIIVVIP